MLERNGNPSFDDVLSLAGIDCEKIFQYCSWSPMNCCAQATPVFDQRYGQCYRMSTGKPPPGSNQQEITQMYPGPGSGVQLIAKGYFPGSSEMIRGTSKGLLLDVVYPDQWMSYSYFQVPVGVGATVLLYLQRTTLINLAGRPERCRQSQPGETNVVRKLEATANGCYYITWARAHNKYCNCNPLPGVASNDTADGIANPGCHPFQVMACPAEINGTVLMETGQQQALTCLPECDRYDYQVSITYAKFDSTPFQGMMRGGNSSNPVDLDENSILMDIFHPFMEHVIVQEVETYTIFSLIGNIGGAAGLWLGASLMSFFQITFYLIKWAELKISDRKSRKRHMISIHQAVDCF